MSMATLKKLLKIAPYNVNGILNLIKMSEMLGKMRKGGGSVAGDRTVREGTMKNLKEMGLVKYFLHLIQQVVGEEWPL